MRIIILRSARRTMSDGIRFYEDQEPGLGAYFLNSIMSDIRQLSIYAGVHQIYRDKYHRMICKTFPFSIYYRIDKSDAVVYAVLDDRRDPEWINDLLT